jgi:hypothetical protein
MTYIKMLWNKELGEQPSAISHQPSAISHQPSAISHQPSAISHQVRNRVWGSRVAVL